MIMQAFDIEINPCIFSLHNHTNFYDGKTFYDIAGVIFLTSIRLIMMVLNSCLVYKSLHGRANINIKYKKKIIVFLFYKTDP